MTRARIVLVLCAVSNWVGYAVRQTVSVQHDDLRALGFTDLQLGHLWFGFMAIHALATPIFGALGDSRWRRPALIGGVLLASLASVGAEWATNYPSLLALRIAAGVGTAAIVPIGAALLSQLFDGPSKATSLSVFGLGLFTGGVSGVLLGGELGYPLGLAIPGLVGIVLSGMLYVATIPPAAQVQSISHAALVGSLRRLTTVAALRWLGLGATLMAFAAGSYVVWLPDFLHYEKHIANPQRLLAITIVFGLFGVVAGGRVADVWAKRASSGRMYAMSLAMLICVPLAAYCIVAGHSRLYVAAACALMFFISWYHAPMAASIDDLAPATDKSRAQSMVNFVMHVLGTASGPLVVAWLRPHVGFVWALCVPLGALALAALCIWRAGRLART